MKWDSAQYLRFERDRTLPAIDLCRRISGAQNVNRIADIGCGPGNSTRTVHGFFPSAYILGLDYSEEMINTAREQHPDIDFDICDASKELGKYAGQFDLVFSNACIQWLPDHPKLLGELFAMLTDGGTLAVQIPMNYDEPIHRIMLEVAAEQEWNGKLSDVRSYDSLTPQGYFDELSSLTDGFEVWQTVYMHRMSSHEDILEWYRGTGMRPYTALLDEQEAKLFEQRTFEKIKQRYPVGRNGEVMFRFPRFFFTAVKHSN